jgi:hypothetical protein
LRAGNGSESVALTMPWIGRESDGGADGVLPCPAVFGKSVG